jgi:hypothetical protein
MAIEEQRWLGDFSQSDAANMIVAVAGDGLS